MIRRIMNEERLGHINGSISINSEGQLLIESQIDDHLIALRVDVTPNAFNVEFAGGFKHGERFDLENRTFCFHDEVDALILLPDAVIDEIPELEEVKEGLKECIHTHWQDPGTVRQVIDELLIAHSANQ
jgi:hypothetical protein